MNQNGCFDYYFLQCICAHEVFDAYEYQIIGSQLKPCPIEIFLFTSIR